MNTPLIPLFNLKEINYLLLICYIINATIVFFKKNLIIFYWFIPAPYVSVTITSYFSKIYLFCRKLDFSCYYFHRDILWLDRQSSSLLSFGFVIIVKSLGGFVCFYWGEIVDFISLLIWPFWNLSCKSNFVLK